MSELNEEISRLRKTASMLREMAEKPEAKLASTTSDDVLAQVYYEGRLNQHLTSLGGK